MSILSEAFLEKVLDELETPVFLVPEGFFRKKKKERFLEESFKQRLDRPMVVPSPS